MTVYLLDTETTDRKAPLEIIEAAWIKITDPIKIRRNFMLPVLETWQQRYKPLVPSTMGALAVHNILPSELEDCPPSSEFKLPADCEYLVGHSIDFDWEAAGSPASVKRICTHAMAQHVWPEATGYSQTALIYMIKGATEQTREWVRGAHGAFQDVLMNDAILNHIIYLRPEIPTWEALWEFSEDCRIPRTCPMKRYEGVLLENLDSGFVEWCLNQYWLDPYFRKGLERVIAKRYAPAPTLDDDITDDLPF